MEAPTQRDEPTIPVHAPERRAIAAPRGAQMTDRVQERLDAAGRDAVRDLDRHRPGLARALPRRTAPPRGAAGVTSCDSPMRSGNGRDSSSPPAITAASPPSAPPTARRRRQRSSPPERRPQRKAPSALSAWLPPANERTQGGAPAPGGGAEGGHHRHPGAAAQHQRRHEHRPRRPGRHQHHRGEDHASARHQRLEPDACADATSAVRPRSRRCRGSPSAGRSRWRSTRVDAGRSRKAQRPQRRSGAAVRHRADELRQG